MPGNIHIIEASWAEYKTQLVQIRSLVFMDEQQVPADLDRDGLDDTALHLLAMSGQKAVGCARLLADGSIGRMAVLKHWRGKGVGSMLLSTAIKLHQQQAAPVIQLSAQVHAIPFYEKSGFEVCSQPYLDANIMHVDMRLAYLKSG
jgi:predicted GNAT family N-acyltransferase